MTDENGEGVQVASNTGWSEFCEWVDTTDVEDYPSLHHLTTFGFGNDPADLAEDIQVALDEDDPEDDDVKSVATGLIKALAAMKDAEIVIVSNGMTTGDESEE